MKKKSATETLKELYESKIRKKEEFIKNIPTITNLFNELKEEINYPLHLRMYKLGFGIIVGRKERVHSIARFPFDLITVVKDEDSAYEFMKRNVLRSVGAVEKYKQEEYE